MFKSKFMNICNKNGVTTENAKKAWEKIKYLAEHIEKNWDDMERLEFMSQEKRLQLREIAAEKGTEYTPRELDELVDFIILIKKTVKDWKD